MSGNPFAPLMAGGNQQNGRNARGGRARSGGIVGGALRKAGLVDEDSGMRDASGLGPKRPGRGPIGNHAGESLSVSLSIIEPSATINLAYFDTIKGKIGRRVFV